MSCTTKDTEKRWYSAIIPYLIHPEITSVNALHRALANWERLTNLRFVRRTRESDYIEFILDASWTGGASNEIGRGGGRQVIKYSGSVNRTFMHEIGHAIGLIHEQKRSDRDEFVRINFDNIKSDSNSRYQFEKMSDSLNSDVYDYRSIMHYSAFNSSFAVDPSIPIIEPLDASISLDLLGSSNTPTTVDVGMINSIYPHLGVIRRSSSQSGAGAVSEISSLTTRNNVVTAVRAGNGNLKMILWRIDAAGGIQRLDTPASAPDLAGEASSISVAQAGINIVTAVRNGSGNLFLISWQIDGNKLVRKADSGSLAGKASGIKIINLTTSLILTACRTGSGDLKLILWRVNAAGEFTRISDSASQAGEVSEISLLKIRSNNNEHVVSTAVRAGNGTMKVITWAVSVSNNSIIRRGDSGSQIGEATNIQSALDQFSHLIVSCRSGSGNLALISMSVSLAAREISRIADTHSMAGEISVNSIVTRNYGVVSGVKDGSGNLRLIKWRINATGQFTRLGDSASSAGEVGLISLKALANNPDAPLCTSVRDGAGNLLLISWDDESQSGELQW